VSEEIALFIDFENIRYSLLNIQRREPDPQDLISVARRYGTVMVARAYADWTRQPDQFKGSLMAAMIDRVDCPAKLRDRFRPYWNGSAANGALTPSERPAGWSADPSNSGYGLALPASASLGENGETEEEGNENYSSESPNGFSSYGASGQSNGYTQQAGALTPSLAGSTPTYTGSSGSTGAKGEGYTEATRSGPLSGTSTGNTGPMSVVQSTVSQSTVDLNMLMDIIETVFDRPTIGTFVLMTGDRDFTRISARLKLRLNKSVIIVGVPGTVSRDLISAASQFVPLTPGSATLPPVSPGAPASSSAFFMSGLTGPMPAIPANLQGTGAMPALVDPLEPGFIQFLDYIDRNWSWRTIIGISNFVGDSINPKNRFRGRLTRESARELLSVCIQEKILTAQQDPSGGEDLRLNRSHPQVEEILRQLSRN
jgi:uncharacterized LabA/DUF88 family protein